MKQNFNYKKAKNTNPYLVQKVMSASPEQLIAYVYEAGATACAKEDRFTASKAVSTLIQALNFEYKETAVTFFNVYRYLNRLISKGKFEEAKTIFADLKQSWAKAYKVV
jgi:flagellin-specific chaperone FliS